MPPAPYPAPAVVRQEVTYSARWRVFKKVIAEADLTAAANGASQDIALGNLPPDVLIHPAPALKLNTQFTGGGAVSCTLSIGTAASPTLVATAFNIFGGTANGLFVAMTRGVQVVAPSGNVQALIARITPDGAHSLLALTAGSCEVAVYFTLPEGRYNP